ncbi:hypothetical protein KCU98_g109, partial [Aureobasidium melanogenum]
MKSSFTFFFLVVVFSVAAVLRVTGCFFALAADITVVLRRFAAPALRPIPPSSSESMIELDSKVSRPATSMLKTRVGEDAVRALTPPRAMISCTLGANEEARERQK